MTSVSINNRAKRSLGRGLLLGTHNSCIYLLGATVLILNIPFYYFFKTLSVYKFS